MVTINSHRILVASLAAALALAACGPEESSDKAPPDYTIAKLVKSQGKYRFGVTDTIQVDFSEKIDTGALAPAFVPAGGVGFKFAGASRALVYGTLKTYSSSHFLINGGEAILTLSGIKDPAGNGRSAAVETFLPYPWVDRDAVDSTFTGYDSLTRDTTAWIDGTPVTDSLIGEGALDFKQTIGTIDFQDAKMVAVKAGDTLMAGITTRKDLNLTFKVAGPFAPAGFDSTLKAFDLDSALATSTTEAKGSTALRVYANPDTYRRKFGSYDAQGLYVIFVTIPQFKEGFYRLGVRIRKFR